MEKLEEYQEIWAKDINDTNWVEGTFVCFIKDKVLLRVFDRNTRPRLYDEYSINDPNK